MIEGQIELIPMELIDRPVKISRETIDPDRVRELAESIREVGLLQPVVLRRVNGRYETVAGDRRFLAHKLLGLKEIKAIVKELDDRDTVVMRGIENLQRENLNASEEGGVYLLLHEEGGLTLDEIAKKVGKQKSTLKRYMRFARLPQEVRCAVDDKSISLATLEVLMQIEDAEWFKFYFDSAAANGVKENVARMFVDEYHRTKAGTFYNEGGGDREPEAGLAPKTVYYTCDACDKSFELRIMTNMVMCPECNKKARHG
jgi:ParB family chromosome partitioning protein